jgi:rod shape-determining protein MreC
MWELIQRHRGMVLVGALLLAPLALLYAQTRAPGARGPVVGLLIDVASVVERGLLWTSGGTSDVLEEYVTSVGMYDELVRLRRYEALSGPLRARMSELEVENESLRSLAGLAARIDGPRPIGARVIGRSGAPLTRLLRIDRGSRDGLRRGDGVVTARGVVGRVLATGRQSSDVLLLTDPSAAVDIVSQRTRARGIVRGTGEEDAYHARVEDFDRLADLRVGDALVTSGLDGRFPAGFLVGEISEVSLREDGLYQLAAVQPAADVARVERVLLLVQGQWPRLPRLGSEPIAFETGGDAGPSDGGEVDEAPVKWRRKKKPDAGPPAPAAAPSAAAESVDEAAAAAPVPSQPASSGFVNGSATRRGQAEA